MTNSTTIVTKLSNSKFAYQIERPNSNFVHLQEMHDYLRGELNIPCLIDLDTKTNTVLVRVFKCKTLARRQASVKLFNTLLKRQEQNTQQVQEQEQSPRVLSDKELTAHTRPQLKQLAKLLGISFKSNDSKAKLTAALSGKVYSTHIKELHTSSNQ